MVPQKIVKFYQRMYTVKRAYFFKKCPSRDAYSIHFLFVVSPPPPVVSPPPPEKDVAEKSRISTQGLLYRKYTVHK